jgi:hypothetical protein
VFLLSEEDPANISKIAEKADRLVALNSPQQHDTVMALPLSSDDVDGNVAAVKKQAKKQSGGKKMLKAVKQSSSSAQ